MRIMQISTIDHGGGAAAVASGLMRAYRERGNAVWMVVGRKQGSDARVLVIPEDQRPFYRMTGYAATQIRLRRLAGRYPNRGWGLAGRALRLATHPGVLLERWRGIEDFEFPGSYEVLDMLDTAPDIVHGHNLHGGYFDLRALTSLSHRVPTVLTLHDMWLLTGHCAYSLGCDRWATGCGSCPDLNLYPAIARDATAENWRRKRDVFEKSRLYVATPSRWLLEKVERSMLVPGMRHGVVIPNGVDLTVFRPADKLAVRAALGIPSDVAVVLLTTVSRGSMWKDDRTIHLAIEDVASSTPALPILYIALGRDAAWTGGGRANVRSVPYQSDPTVVAQYYQAADLYLHSAHADTFPNTVLEALACGTPVVATDVGGIPEQVVPLSAGPDVATGVLVPPADHNRLARAMLALLADNTLREQLGRNASKDARLRFNLDLQVDRYLDWYTTAIADWKTLRTASERPSQPDVRVRSEHCS